MHPPWRTVERQSSGSQLGAAGWYEAEGGFLRKQDLEDYRTGIELPVAVDYGNNLLCKCGPWTQGPWLLQAARLMAGFPAALSDDPGTEYYHALIESMKLALADRDTYFGDPDFVDVPIDALLCDLYVDRRRALINPRPCSRSISPAILAPWRRWPPPGRSGTTDREGRYRSWLPIDSAIPSP